MSDVATVSDLLASLDYGKSSAEQDIILALHERFSVPNEQDLYEALQDEPPARVFAAILDVLQPFTRMVRDIYDFLATASVVTAGNLEVHIDRESAEDLSLDLAVLKQFERQLTELINQSALDINRLSQGKWWWQFHDGYFAPMCCSSPSLLSGAFCKCDFCPPETRVDQFEQLTAYYVELDRLASAVSVPTGAITQALPSQAPFRTWSKFREWWEQSKNRDHRRSGCVMEIEWTRTYFEGAIQEFNDAKDDSPVKRLRRIFALPYWEQRWQLYEVWFVMMVLQSYGLQHLKLHTRGLMWTLKVGRVAQEPIATGTTSLGEIIEFYYQFQGHPPKAIFPDTVSRPELIVRKHGLSTESQQTILVAEVKARKNYDLKDLNSALFPLMEWDSLAIVAANYFGTGRQHELASTEINKVKIAAADGCAPGSEIADELIQWLERFWETQLGESVKLIMIDTSPSMEKFNLPAHVLRLIELLSSAGAGDSGTVVAQFGKDLRIHVGMEYIVDVLTPDLSGVTSFINAMNECTRYLGQHFPRIRHLTVHLVSDLRWRQDEISALIDWSTSDSVKIKVHILRTDHVYHLTSTNPKLQGLILYL